MGTLRSLVSLPLALTSPHQTGPEVHTWGRNACCLGERIILIAMEGELQLWNFTDFDNPSTVTLRLPAPDTLTWVSVSQPHGDLGEFVTPVFKCHYDHEVVMMTLQVAGGGTVVYAVQREGLLRYAYEELEGIDDFGNVPWEKWGPRFTRAMPFPNHDGCTVVGPSVFGRRGALALFEAAPGHEGGVLDGPGPPVEGRWKLVLFDFFYWPQADPQRPLLASSWRVSELRDPAVAYVPEEDYDKTPVVTSLPCRVREHYLTLPPGARVKSTQLWEGGVVLQVCWHFVVLQICTVANLLCDTASGSTEHGANVPCPPLRHVMECGLPGLLHSVLVVYRPSCVLVYMNQDIFAASHEYRHSTAYNVGN